MISSMDKNQQREQVLNDNNVAQEELEHFLKKLPKKTKELNVNVPLHGHVNLAILTKLGFNNIRTILFQEHGQVTSITNIPEKVKILSCCHNLLKELRELPEDLEELRVSNNIIQELDVSKCKKLDKMYLSFNQLNNLSGLPEVLTLLFCDHNNLVHLDLGSTVRLESLRCDNNPQLTLENIPDTIIQGDYPSTMVQNNKKTEEKIGDDYVLALNSYFRMKNIYEEDLREKLRDKKKTKPKCKGCEKAVGMIFSCANNKYQARCGGNPPCDWSIVLHRGSFQHRDDVLYAYYEDVEDMKEKIIKQKMSTLFRHTGEKKAAELFQQEMKAYETAKEFLDDMLAKHDELYHHIPKYEKIQEFQKKIYLLLERVQNALREGRIEEAAEIQFKEIMPLSRAIQYIQYEVMYVDFDGIEFSLVQDEVSNIKKEVNLGEAPSIEKN